MNFDSEFGDENLLDDCSFDDDDDMSSLLIPAVEIGNVSSNDDSVDMNPDPNQLLDVLHCDDENTHMCTFCGKGFKRRSHLQRHIRLHTGEQPYPCPHCHLRFARSERRNQHVMRVHQQVSDNTQQQGTTPNGIENAPQHKPAPFNFFLCGICDVEFEKASELKEHMTTHTRHPDLRARKVYNCDQCVMEFTRYDHLVRHQTVHSGDKSYQCRFCLKYFTRSDNRTKHEKSCKALQAPLNGHIELPSQNISQNGQNTIPDVDPLEIINVTSILKQEFGEYEGDPNDEDLFDNTDMFDDIDGEPNTATPEQTRKTQNEADEDLLRMGGIRRRIQRPRLTQTEIDTLTCNVCNKTLTQKYHLVRHKLIHMGDQKPYKCTICDRTFARRENLKHHLLVHKKYKAKPGPSTSGNQSQSTSISGGKSCFPKVVQKRFEPRKLNTLRDQLLMDFELYAIKYRQDTSNAVYFHDFYEKCFNYMGNLFMKNIHSLKKDMFIESPAAATQVKQVPQLTQVKTEPNVRIAIESVNAMDEESDADGNAAKLRKMECGVCQAVFPSVSHLKRHLVQHTGEKAHHCELCGRDFTRAEHKKRHMMAVHMNKQLYECEICCKRFSRSDHMVSHFRVHHAGIKPYTCKFLCGERFDTFKDKLAHSRNCMYVPPNPDSPDREGDISDNEFLEPEQSMLVDFDDIEPVDDITPQLVNPFIKTEKEDVYDDALGY